MSQSSSCPRSPGPMWATEIRSLAPRIRAYETALGTTAAPITAADPAKKVLRSVFVSNLLIVVAPSRYKIYVGEYPTHTTENVKRELRNLGQWRVAGVLLLQFASTTAGGIHRESTSFAVFVQIM